MSGNGSNRRCIFTYFYQHMYFYLFLPTDVFLPIFTNFMRTLVTRWPTRSQPNQYAKSDSPPSFVSNTELTTNTKPPWKNLSYTRVTIHYPTRTKTHHKLQHPSKRGSTVTDVQLDIFIEQHTRTLATIEHKIEHSTTRIQRNSTDHEQASNIIRITDNIRDKYTKLHLVKNVRSHNNNGQKQIKRLGTNHTTSTITNANDPTNNATIYNLHNITTRTT